MATDAGGLGFGLNLVFCRSAVNCRKNERQSGKRSEICLSSERSEGELFRFPLCRSLFRGPRRGSSPRSPFFAYFLWRSKESEWPAGASPGQPLRSDTRIASPKCKPNRITENKKCKPIQQHPATQSTQSYLAFDFGAKQRASPTTITIPARSTSAVCRLTVNPANPLSPVTIIQPLTAHNATCASGAETVLKNVARKPGLAACCSSEGFCGFMPDHFRYSMLHGMRSHHAVIRVLPSSRSWQACWYLPARPRFPPAVPPQLRPPAPTRYRRR